MKILLGVIFMTLNCCVLFCSAQIGGAGTWAGAGGGAPLPGGYGGLAGRSAAGDLNNYGYAGVDSRGTPYGGAGGNGGYYVGGVDDNGRRYSYSGGAGVRPGEPGSFSYDYNGRPGYGGVNSYADTYGRRNYYYYNAAGPSKILQHSINTLFLTFLAPVLILINFFKVF